MREELTVHEALCDIKVANAKISAAARDLLVVKANKASAENVNGVPIKDFSERAKSQYQKVMDLIRRTEALKAAVNESNAKTTIKVDGKEYTISSAIYMMKSGVQTKKELLFLLRKQLVSATKEVNDMNGELLDARTDKYIESTFGTSKDSKVNAKEVEEAIASFRKSQSYVIIDPLSIQDEIDKLTDEIDTFESHVDSAIQMSNATTMIEIEY